MMIPIIEKMFSVIPLTKTHQAPRPR
jgi:hypothetical protein